MKNILLITIAALVLVFGVVFLKMQKTKFYVAKATPSPVVSFKPVSTDNSFNSIETDIDTTVIAKEDFSDLK